MEASIDRGMCVVLGLAGGLAAPAAARGRHLPGGRLPRPVDRRAGAARRDLVPELGRVRRERRLRRERRRVRGRRLRLRDARRRRQPRSERPRGVAVHSAPPGTQIDAVEVYRSFYAGAEHLLRVAGRHDPRRSPRAAAGDARRLLAGVRLRARRHRPATELDAGERDRVQRPRGDQRRRGDRGLRRRPDLRGRRQRRSVRRSAPTRAWPPTTSTRSLVTLEDDTAPIPGARQRRARHARRARRLRGRVRRRDRHRVGALRGGDRGRRPDRRRARLRRQRRPLRRRAAPASPLRFDWNVPCPLAGSGDVTFDTADARRRRARGERDRHRRRGQHGDRLERRRSTPTTRRRAGSRRSTATRRSGRRSSRRAAAGRRRRPRSPTSGCAAMRAARACTTIPGATTPSYTVAPADAYGQLAVLVNAADGDGSTSATSPPTGAVLDTSGYVEPAAGADAQRRVEPADRGQTEAGLDAHRRAGKLVQRPLSYAYQWQRCDSAGSRDARRSPARRVDVHARARGRLRPRARARQRDGPRRQEPGGERADARGRGRGARRRRPEAPRPVARAAPAAPGPGPAVPTPPTAPARATARRCAPPSRARRG